MADKEEQIQRAKLAEQVRLFVLVGFETWHEGGLEKGHVLERCLALSHDNLIDTWRKWKEKKG